MEWVYEIGVGKQPTVGAGKPAPTSALRSFAYTYFIHPVGVNPFNLTRGLVERVQVRQKAAR